MKNIIIINMGRVFARFIIAFEIKFKRLVRQLSGEKKILLGFGEMWNIYYRVKNTAMLPGDIAELGVFSGGSAKLICEIKGRRSLHLFDTFSGLPPNEFSINKINRGEIRGGSLSEVKDYLAKYDNIFFYEGIFPDSVVELGKKSLRFSFVHLDADIYESTLDGLKFFYPLMVKNGVILIHDYYNRYLPGAKKAVSEFLKDKPEEIIVLQGKAITGFNLANKVINRFYYSDQAMIIKKG